MMQSTMEALQDGAEVLRNIVAEHGSDRINDFAVNFKAVAAIIDIAIREENS